MQEEHTEKRFRELYEFGMKSIWIRVGFCMVCGVNGTNQFFFGYLVDSFGEEKDDICDGLGFDGGC